MKDTWTLLKTELAYQGFLLLDTRELAYYTSEGKLVSASMRDVVSILTREIKENKSLFAELWQNVEQIINNPVGLTKSISREERNLFIFSIKELASLLEVFPDVDDTPLQQTLNCALNYDYKDFSKEQMSLIIDLKLSIDWVHRLISRLLYIRKLILLAAKGKTQLSSNIMKEARGVSGPWANLDLPMRERVFDWSEEDENFRGRDRDIRNQRRYRKGLENYNNDGSVGEGHYWREIRNEPFSWYDRDSADPYPTRNTLSRWG